MCVCVCVEIVLWLCVIMLQFQCFNRIRGAGVTWERHFSKAGPGLITLHYRYAHYTTLNTQFALHPLTESVMPQAFIHLYKHLALGTALNPLTESQKLLL